MNINNEEKSIAQRLLDKCKEYERKNKLTPVQLDRKTSVMIPPNYTDEQLEEKRKKYLK